jgi:predicted O-methyltransferase YrrM
VFKTVPDFLSANERSLLADLFKANALLKIPSLPLETCLLLHLIVHLKKPKNIFEFGSGVGASAFWMFAGGNVSTVQRCDLTEVRADCAELFKRMAWPKSWLEKFHFHEGVAQDAVELCLTHKNKKYDILLMDGKKAEYESFLNRFYPYLSQEALVIIDNYAWGMSSGFTSPKKRTDHSSIKMDLFRENMVSQIKFRQYPLPMPDGIMVLVKN